jgi:hypothetical protein
MNQGGNRAIGELEVVRDHQHPLDAHLRGGGGIHDRYRVLIGWGGNRQKAPPARLENGDPLRSGAARQRADYLAGDDVERHDGITDRGRNERIATERGNWGRFDAKEVPATSTSMASAARGLVI